MGAILRSSSAPQGMHFSFDSDAISQDVYVFSSLCSCVGGFQPPKPETSE